MPGSISVPPVTGDFQSVTLERNLFAVFRKVHPTPSSALTQEGPQSPRGRGATGGPPLAPSARSTPILLSF